MFPTAGTSFNLPKDIPAEVTDREERRFLELAKTGRTLAGIALETRHSEFDTAARAFDLHQRGPARGGARAGHAARWAIRPASSGSS